MKNENRKMKNLNNYLGLFILEKLSPNQDKQKKRRVNDTPFHYFKVVKSTINPVTFFFFKLF